MKKAGASSPSPWPAGLVLPWQGSSGEPGRGFWSLSAPPAVSRLILQLARRRSGHEIRLTHLWGGSIMRLMVVRFCKYSWLALACFLSSCCLPLSPLAACYIPPSDAAVMRYVKEGKYSPYEAYVFLCKQIESKHPDYFDYGWFPYPRFSIIKGKYFFPVRQDNMLACTYSGWEFNQHTGEYRPIHKSYVRLYIDCYNNSREYIITKDMSRFITLEENIRDGKNMDSRSDIKEVMDFYLDFIHKIDKKNKIEK